MVKHRRYSTLLFMWLWLQKCFCIVNVLSTYLTSVVAMSYRGEKQAS